MRIIDIDEKEGICLKCHMDLSIEEKKNRMSICIKCMTELVDIIKDGVDSDADGIEEFSDDVNSFTDFVSSSARLMGLDDIVVIQVCFNIYMDWVRDIADRNPTIARKIFKDARRFIDIELERLEDSGEDDLDKHDLGRGDFFEQMMDSVNKMMKDCHKTNGKTGDIGGKEDNIISKKVRNATDKFTTKNEIIKDDKNGSKEDNKKGDVEENK